MSRTRQTVLYAVLALGLGELVGWLWIASPGKGWLTQFLMWTPGVAALLLTTLVRKEPPRALGFSFTGTGPWLAAYLYPFGVFTGCIALAYACDAVLRTQLIVFHPEVMKATFFGAEHQGLSLLGWRFLSSLLVMLPWLVLALAYRFQVPERFGRARPLAAFLLWAQVFWFNPGRWWIPPGTIGEELGWRGFVVRLWKDRPLTSLALTSAMWAAFHLPVVIHEEPLHAFVPALAFLASIAAAAAVFQALYLWSGSVWPPIVAHFSWNFWNPFILGNQYGPSKSVFGGVIWVINGEGLFGLVFNGLLTVFLVLMWRKRQASATPLRME
ncbi:MAG: CPBP family intramembrane metalloprotease [Deltaproteobacteria bacterium]|nr:CPBP family intramembrane metalloprotease [Deltaproteobacteria bacterium]